MITAHRSKELSQFFTPTWVAEAIVEHHFSYLSSGDTVVEPSVGDGRFLTAIPPEVNVIGVEIDPAQAAAAARRSGRRVIVGDFLEVDLPKNVRAVIGNPPFKAPLIAGFLDRAHSILQDGGEAGLILPAYVLQTSSKVVAMSERWSIVQELLPRNIFPRLSLPIVFAKFTKDTRRRLFGFFLYEQAAEVAGLSRDTRTLLSDGREAPAADGSRARTSVWRDAVHLAFDLIEADEAPLQALYRALEKRRPTANPHFREKVRQTLQAYPEFKSDERGVWARAVRSNSPRPARATRASAELELFA